MIPFSRPANWRYHDGTCHELGHTWHPSCLYCAAELFLFVYWSGAKIYLPLYLISDILRRRHPKAIVFQTLPYVLRSSLFLGINGGGFLAFICLVRKLIGRFYFYSSAFLPAFLASFIAILVERKSRRGMLMGYVGTLAVELVYSMLKYRGYVSPVPYGEVFLFCFASGVLLHAFRSKAGLHDAVGSLLKLVFTPWVPPPVQKLMLSLQSGPPTPGNLLMLAGADIALVALWNFGLGYLIQAAIAIFSSGAKALRPGQLKKLLLRSYNAKFGAFQASLAAGFKVLSFLLFLLAVPKDLRLVVAGLLAGLSMLWIRSSSISLYVAGKALEVLYFKAVGKGWLPKFYYGDAVIYSIATAILFHAAFFESHNMRLAYWRFLENATWGRIWELNFKEIDSFGTEASKRATELRQAMDQQQQAKKGD